jgi:hypothetical protein
VTQTALKPGLKLPPKPGAIAGSGLKLPTKTAISAGIKLPPKPVIRKPGANPTVSALPKPVAAVAPKAEEAAEAKSAEPVKPVAVDAGGVVKLPTVEMKAVDRNAESPAPAEEQKPLEALKSVTQKLKGTTQQIPQQAILRKTGIIADSVMSEAQKQAAKSKTARISLSEAIGAAPVKNENAPMKTIRIKRPVEIPTAAKTEAADPAQSDAAPAAAETADTNAAATVTQRKTLKISRPGGGVVRPGGKFGVKRPGQTAAAPKADTAAAPAEGGNTEPAVADIADIPDMPSVAALPSVDSAAVSADDGPAWLVSLSTIVQVAACVAIGALAWFLFENTQIVYF